MCAEGDHSSGSDDQYGDFVPAVFARSAEEAEEYCELLNDHDIPAILGEDDKEETMSGGKKRNAMTHGVPVLVPEALLDEASEIIADREDADDFEPDDDVEDEDEDEDDDLELDVKEADEDADEDDLDEKNPDDDEEDIDENPDDLDEEEEDEDFLDDDDDDDEA